MGSGAEDDVVALEEVGVRVYRDNKAAVSGSWPTESWQTKFQALEEDTTMKTTRTRTQSLLEAESETHDSTARKDAPQFQVSEISMQEQIASLAYAIWEQRGSSHGSAEEDWKQAERELRHHAKAV